MRRYIAVLVAGAALIVAACAEPVSVPTKDSQQWVPMLSPHVTAAPANMWAIEQAGTFTFTLNPEGGHADIGVYNLEYDANAVCDPATSGYGPSYWRETCQTIDTAITITAKFWVEDGHTYSDFSPDIRFDPSKYVWVSAVVPSIRGLVVTDSLRDRYSVMYTRVVNGMRYFIDEAATDPGLATMFGEDAGVATGLLQRRLLHFSGYYVRSGRVCDDETGVCSDATVDAGIE